MKTLIKAMTKNMEQEDEKLYALKQEVSGVIEKSDIVYAKDLRMDYYVPKNSIRNEQVYIVDVHGGAWVYGDKKLNRHFCMHLAKRGFLTFNLNYDLIPTVTVKQQVQQIITALHYIHEHETAYGIQKQKVCLSGDSAGAHLVSLVAAICRDKNLQKEYQVDCQNIHVDALLLQHGIYDLKPMKQSHNLYMKKLYQMMFPSRDIQTDCLWSCVDATWNIPTFLLSSAKDDTFAIQTMKLTQRFDELHVPYDLLYWDEQYCKLRHVFHIAFPDWSESQITFDRMANFLNQL